MTNFPRNDKMENSLVINDIVEYKEDWKKGRKWLIESIYDGKARIYLIRDGEKSTCSITNISLDCLIKI